MTITIPSWLLYILGGIGAFAGLLLMGLGVLFIIFMWNYKPWGS